MGACSAPHFSCHGRRHRQGPAAQGGHATARPPARRRAARADRRCGIRAHRGDPPDRDPLPPGRRPTKRPRVKRELGALLNELPIAQTLEVVRAFSYFSHLVNIAEDVHQNRRRRAHAHGRLAAASGQHRARAGARCARRGIDAAALAPLVRRRAGEPGADGASDRGAAREHPRLRARDRAAAAMARSRDAHARRSRQTSRPDSIARCSRCGRPRCCACPSCGSSDEIDNGLAFYRYTFLDRDPAPLRRTRRAPARRLRDGGGHALARRSCAWVRGSAATATAIPIVVADTLANAIGAQATLAFTHYLEQVHRLGAELSLSSRLVTPTTELLALAAAGARHQSASRGRAVSPGADRHLFAARGDGARARGRGAARVRRRRRLRSTHRRRSCSPTCETIRASLPATARSCWRRDGWSRLIRAVEVFGFHLAVLDLRQNADVHEVVVGELLARAGVASRLRRAFRGRARRAARARARRSAPAATRRIWPIRRARTAELAILRVAADIHRRFGAGGAAELRDLEVPVGERPARSRHPAQGSRAAARRAELALNIIPLFETIDDLQAVRRRS